MADTDTRCLKVICVPVDLTSDVVLVVSFPIWLRKRRSKTSSHSLQAPTLIPFIACLSLSISILALP